MSSLLPNTDHGVVDLNVNVSKLFRILYISTLLSITTLFMNVSIEAEYRFCVYLQSDCLFFHLQKTY